MTTAPAVTAPPHPATAVRTRGALVVAGATLAPAAVWLIARAAGTTFTLTLAGQPPMTIDLPFVVVTALAASLAGWAARAVLQRATSHARVLWTGLAVAALLLSFGPVAAAQTDPATRAFLALMHLAVAAVLIIGLRRTVPTHEAADPQRSHS